MSVLIDLAKANVVHLMTCKASKFALSMAAMRRKGKTTSQNADVVVCSYGTEDITMVPFIFASGMHR